MRFAFLGVGAASILATILAVGLAHALERRGSDIATNMLAGVRLLGQVQHQVDEQRVLVDEHIASTDSAEMARLDEQIARTQRELVATTNTYDPWAYRPRQRITWQALRTELAVIQKPIANALALSRQNRDVEARSAMRVVTARYETIGDDLARLIAVNDSAASVSLVSIASIGRELMLALLALGLPVTGATLLMGRWASRQVADRERDMERHAEVLEQRNRDLDAFAGRVAHDIRGPLAIIALATTQVTRDAGETPATEKLRRATQRIESITDDLLTLAGVGAQVLGRCDPAAVASQVQEDFAARVGALKGSLHVVVEHADVSCSEGLLRQALANLTENALKYRRREVAPEVDISGHAKDGGYTLRVSDNGIGLSTDEVSRVFDPFYRSPSARELPGTGLGLSIVRRVAEASGGKVWAESQPGVGSAFVVQLRLANGDRDTSRGVGPEGQS